MTEDDRKESARGEAALPGAARRIADGYPDVWAAFTNLGKACSGAGSIDPRTHRLVKLALAIGAGLEGAVHSHARRAMAEGIAIDELRHVALLAMPTLGFSSALRALTWIDDLSSAVDG
ncbi:MAG: carboxymuconolactone decarboxylase family protein [Bauldia sp.]|nr:carboxymuconolactone decarboxylase family protein [Bauldia sp.]